MISELYMKFNITGNQFWVFTYKIFLLFQKYSSLFSKYNCNKHRIFKRYFIYKTWNKMLKPRHHLNPFKVQIMEALFLNNKCYFFKCIRHLARTKSNPMNKYTYPNTKHLKISYHTYLQTLQILINMYTKIIKNMNYV